MNRSPLILPAGFRKLPLTERRRLLLELLDPPAEVGIFFQNQNRDLDLCEAMVENAVGYMEIPLGLVLGLPVNGREWNLPLATEEPSVIAAATFAGRLLKKGGGLEAEASEPVMEAQVFLESCAKDTPERLQACKSEIEAALRSALASMEARGGGLRGLSWNQSPSGDLWEVSFFVDVRDAMGANLLNTAAEKVSPLLEKITGGRRLMAILSNDGTGRLAQASFRLPFAALAKSDVSGEEMARRLVVAGEVAQWEPKRAITHNKGILNGLSALALATGNDTRAVEAAAHAWAARGGCYRGLSTYSIAGDFLEGRLELPVTLATVGGAMGFHPGAELALGILGRPSARELSALGAALGLAQNFAALYALTAEGIQSGHMALHSRRSAYRTGARGETGGPARA